MRIHRPKSIMIFFFSLFFLVGIGLDSEVFARAGGGRSSGSSRGFSSGRTAPRSPSSSPSQKQYQQPTQPQPGPSAPGMGRGFLSGMAGGIAGGLLGSMLFRGLGFAGSGSGMGEGFGFGDIFLILIILGIIYFVVKRFRARQTAMQMSTAGAGSSPYSFPGPSPGPIFTPPPPEENAGGATFTDGLRHIKAMDPSFDEKNFKDLAGDVFFKIQGSWTRRDLNAVRSLLTPEMFGILKKDLDELIARKQINRLENIAVREVEIVDAGQERGEDFITVRLYANLLDYVVDEKSGEVLSGSSSDPVKFVEFWTFTRNVGEKNWALAGITQEGGR
jgi:predicted lipid-binding transport protein (Tim44 family)